MADYTDSKSKVGAQFPDHAVDAQEWQRVEPLLTPQQLKKRHLFGIPLVSFLPDPITGQREVLEMEDLKDFINRAVAEVELETGLTIFPVQFDEKYPFEMNFWRSFGFLQVKNRPVSSVDVFAFTPANNQDIFQLNPEWIEPSNFHKGQINIIPMVPAAAAQFISGTPSGVGGNAYLTFLQGMSWIPAIIRVKYTCGFPDGMLPKILNEIIGATAALEILAALASTNKAQGYMLTMDGMSQSVQSPGPQIYMARMEFLKEKREQMIRKVRNIWGLQIHMNYV